MHSHRRSHLVARLSAGAAILFCAGTLVACGGDDQAAKPSSEAQAADGAVKYAKCMRGHGVDIPDPKQGPDGETMIAARPTPGASDGPQARASAACDKFLGSPSDERRDPAAEAKQRDAFATYARCMRGKGIDIPDPTGSGDAPTITGQGTARFDTADRACHGLLGQDDPGAPAGAAGAPATSAP